MVVTGYFAAARHEFILCRLPHGRKRQSEPDPRKSHDKPHFYNIIQKLGRW